MYPRTALNVVSIIILKIILSPLIGIFILTRGIILGQLERRYVIEEDDEPDWIDDEDNDAVIQEELTAYDELEPLPDMQQIFNLDKEKVIGVQFVSFCPDETAHIRIIGDTTFSPLYKRKVYRDKSDKKERYIQINGKRCYLNEHTKSVDPIQAKEGK